VGLTLLNPIEVFKIFVIKMLATNLEVLGVGGMYLDFLFGQYLLLFLMGWLLFISALVWGISYWLFQQQEEF
jgi:hypothetical protein